MSNKLVDKKESGKIEKLADKRLEATLYKKIKESSEIYGIRRAKFFVPMFSDRFYTICNRVRIAVLLVCVFSGMLSLVLFGIEELKGFTFALVGFTVAAILLYTVGYKYLMKHLMTAGFDLQSGYVVRKDFFGHQSTFLYSELEQAIRSGYMGYNGAGLYLGTGQNKLIFHYEKGEEIAQRHLEECYKELKRHIQIEILPYKKKLTNKEEKKRKNIKMGKYRRREHFLPMYSDYYFEKKDNARETRVVFYVSGMILTAAINVATQFQSSFVKFLLFVACSFVVYQALLFEPWMNYKKKLGFTLQADCIVRTGIFGLTRKIFYPELERQIIDGAMKYGTTGIRLGKGRNKMVFHYEIGDTTAQKHVDECYDELQGYMQTRLIPYEKEGLEILDKKYVYDRSRRMNIISLIVALFLSGGYMAGDNVGSADEVVMCCMLFAPWEYLSLFMLAKNAGLSKKAYVQLQELMEKHSSYNVKLRGKYVGWITFLVMSVLVLVLNCLFICTV